VSITVTPTSRRHRQAVDGGPASAGGADHEAERATAQALAAIALPPARAEDRATLRRSIEADGVLVPVIVSAGPACRGEVADGKLRVELAAELGRECPSEQRPFTSEAAFRHFRLISNLARRQLGTAARIRLGLALEPWLKAQAAARKAQAVGRPRGEKTVPVALPEEKGETRALVARQVGLKPSTYSRGAKVLREGSPELVGALEAEKSQSTAPTAGFAPRTEPASGCRLPSACSASRRRFRRGATRCWCSTRPGPTRRRRCRTRQ